MKSVLLFLALTTSVDAFMVAPMSRSPGTSLQAKTVGEQITGYFKTLVSSAEKWKQETSQAKQDASVQYRNVLETSSQKWAQEKAQAVEEAHTQYHATLDAAVAKWNLEKMDAQVRYRATLEASAAKWAQEKALAEAEAGVLYRRKLETAAQKWKNERAQKELHHEIGRLLSKEKKVNAEFMDKELHVHDSLWNEIEHSLERDPYFRF